jgi:hypothetical protein
MNPCKTSKNKRGTCRKRFILAFTTALLAFALVHPAQVCSIAKATAREIKLCVLSIIDIKDQIVSVSPADFYPAI